MIRYLIYMYDLWKNEGYNFIYREIDNLINGKNLTKKKPFENIYK